jgi:hypothetical protein
MLKQIYSITYDFECDVLKGVAKVDTSAFTNVGPVITPETADPLLPFNATGHEMVCHNRDECGIRSGESDGSPVYDWERCPAHKIFFETHALPMKQQVSEG